jgi:hypothetical protein
MSDFFVLKKDLLMEAVSPSFDVSCNQFDHKSEGGQFDQFENSFATNLSDL